MDTDIDPASVTHPKDTAAAEQAFTSGDVDHNAWNSVFYGSDIYACRMPDRADIHAVCLFWLSDCSRCVVSVISNTGKKLVCEEIP